MKNILVIPDSHATHGFNNRRYEWLGHLVNDLKPDVVVDIGDWWDFPSLSSYESSARKAYEQKSYQKDLEAGLDAQDRMMSIIRKQKRKLPRFIRCLGNHEDRISRVVDADPILKGAIGLEDLLSSEYGWEEHPYLEQVEVEDVRFAHYFATGVSGRPVSGENPGLALITKQLQSCVQGHSHLLDYAVRTSAAGRRLMGLTVGCYLEDHLAWADATAHMWYPCVCFLRNTEAGQYDLQVIKLSTIKRVYGGK